MVPRRRRGTPRGCPAPSRVCGARGRRGPPLRPQRCVPTGARAPLCEHGGPRHPPETVGAAYVRFIPPGVLQTVRRCAGGLQTFSVKDPTVTILGAGLPGLCRGCSARWWWWRACGRWHVTAGGGGYDPRGPRRGAQRLPSSAPPPCVSDACVRGVCLFFLISIFLLGQKNALIRTRRR